jgi:hypothetical protein
MEFFSLLNYDKQKGRHGAAVKSLGSSTGNKLLQKCREIRYTRASGRTLQEGVHQVGFLINYDKHIV